MKYIDEPKRTMKEDRFYFSKYAIEQAENIASFPMAGFTVGIFGGWGSGKSTFMKFMKEHLEHLDYSTIWFDAWLYDKREDMLVALVEEVVTQGNVQKPSPKLNVLRSQVIMSAFKVASAALSPMTGGLINPQVVKQIGAAIDSGETKTSFIKQFKDDFSEVIQSIIEDSDEKKKVIIFLDDLDRCLPSNVIELLESLKLYFNEMQCVFVIGVDRTVVEQAVASHYGGPWTNHARDYLDKIVLMQFDIPPITEELLRKEYLESLVERHGEPAGILVIVATAGNPRKIIRLMNTMDTILVRADSEGWNSNKIIAHLFTGCLQVCFPTFYLSCLQNVKGAAQAISFLANNTIPSPQNFSNNNIDNFNHFRDDISITMFLRSVSSKFGNSPPWHDSPTLVASLSLR